MEIAFVRARYSAQGGAERFAAQAIRALVATDEQVDVAVLARRWEAPATDIDPPVRVVRCDPFYLGSTWRDASFAAAVRERLAREAFDLVQSHERIVGLPVYRAGDGVHAAWLERRSRALSWSGRFAIAANPHHRYLLKTERAMFEHRDLRAVICNSRMVIDEITTRFAIDPAKLVLIRNGVDIAHFDPAVRAVHRDAMRAQLAIDDGAPVFAFVGSGFERKGLAQAIDALVTVPEATLIVVGADKNAASYVARAAARGVASRVRFVGAVADPLPYLAMADAFVLPTLYDPFPNAALEAWATGLPVITSDASGAAELIDEGINGWVVDAYHPAPLVAAMHAAASGIDRTAAARATALRCALPALADELVTLYRRLLAA